MWPYLAIFEVSKTSGDFWIYFESGQVVKAGDSQSEGHEFESYHPVMDWNFNHELVVKFVMFVSKRPKINEKEAEEGQLKNS